MKSPRLRGNIWLIFCFLFSAILTLVFYVSHQLKAVKEPLLAFLKSQIRGEIQIQEAKASLLPPGLRLKGIQLFAPGETEPAAAIEEADLSFKLFPLIQREIDTKISIKRPQIQLVLGTDGKNNFEKIFEPLLSSQPAAPAKLGEKLWWKRLSVSKLVIRDARFSSSEARNATPTELQNLDVEASNLRLESATEPAIIEIEFDLPRLSRESVEIQVKLQHDPKQEVLNVQEGAIEWGAARMNLTGKALLPSAKREGVELDLGFQWQDLDLKKFSKSFVKPLPLEGDLSGQGSLQGSAFSPVLQLALDSRSLRAAGRTIERLHAEIRKKDKVVEIQKAEMSTLGGQVQATGTLLPEKTVSGNFLVDLKGLSLAALSGKPHPARLSGKLDVNASDVADFRSFSGEGNIVAGPFPLPVMDLKEKMRVAEFLADGTLLAKAINLGFLSSSANVIGTQIDSVNAAISFSGDDLLFNSFRLSNSHFSAAGSGSLKNQKNIRASGTATLSTAVTTLLFPDNNFRSALTGGKGGLSVPFHLSGTTDNPDFAIDSGYLKELVAKAAAASLKNMILGNAKPQDLLNSALKETPLGKILPPANNTSGGAKKNSNKPKNFEQFLFGR